MEHAERPGVTSLSNTPLQLTAERRCAARLIDRTVGRPSEMGDFIQVTGDQCWYVSSARCRTVLGFIATELNGELADRLAELSRSPPGLASLDLATLSQAQRDEFHLAATRALAAARQRGPAPQAVPEAFHAMLDSWSELTQLLAGAPPGSPGEQG